MAERPQGITIRKSYHLFEPPKNLRIFRSASLLQIYQKSENSIRLVLLDEAFSKMTSDRIRPMMELFRRLLASDKSILSGHHWKEAGEERKK